MGRHGEAKKHFQILFPNLAREKPELFARYRDVNGIIDEYITKNLKKKTYDATTIDLAGPDRQASQGLVSHLKKHYGDTDTNTSQKSTINALLEKEFSQIVSQGVITPATVRLNLYDPDKLIPLIKKIWLAVPRKGGSFHPHLKDGKPNDSRLSMQLVNNGNEVVAASLEVAQRFNIEDVHSLLVTHRKQMIIAIYKMVPYEERQRARGIMSHLRQKFYLKVNLGHFSPDYGDLPPAIVEAILIYEERAEHGLENYSELKSLAERDGVPLTPHQPLSIVTYVSTFVGGIRRLKLPLDATLNDMLVLSTREIVEKGKVVGHKSFSPLIEKLQSEEQAKHNPGYKVVGADSIFFCMFIRALVAICRFNGIFFAVKTLYETLKFAPDRNTLKDKRFSMKTVMSIDWVDTGIANSLKTFHELVDSQKFLYDEKALIICCGLPQLMTLRMLGYRQECIRMSQQRKNITVGDDGSILFHFDRKEIKNQVLIHQLFSPEDTDGMEEIVQLREVLKKYKTGVLQVFERRYPEYYQAEVGASFYVMPVYDAEGRLLIKRFPVVPEGLKSKQIAIIENESRNLFYVWFQTAVKLLLDFSVLIGYEYTFHPHYLRALCCQWMRDVLGWDWDQIEDAMGDLKLTLQRSYYTDGMRIQTANPFIETSKKRLAEKEAKAQAANSVPVESLQVVNQSLVLVTTENKEIREERHELRVENTSLRDERTILHEQVSQLSREVTTLNKRIASMPKSADPSPEGIEEEEDDELVLA